MNSADQHKQTTRPLLPYAALLLIMLSSAGVAGEVAFLAYTQGFWQVWHMRADGHAQTQVTRTPYDKHRISWYPDGEHLLVNGLQGELVKAHITTGVETPLALPLRGMDDAVLSPDGGQIAFSLSTAESRDINNIWLTDGDGGGQRKLTHSNVLQHQPSWSADATELYFVAGDGGQSHDIWRLQLEPYKLEQVTSGRLYHFDVVVSVKGELAFSSNRSGNYEIWTLMPGQEAARITDDPGLDAHPSWSPDGTSIIFESTRGGAVPNLWRIDLPSGQPKRLTDFPRGARGPAWRFAVGEQS